MKKTFTSDDFLYDGKPMAGLCGHCQHNVDSFDPDHRVTSIVRGGRGVECVRRGDIQPWEGGPLRYMGTDAQPCPHPQEAREPSIANFGDPEWLYCAACACVLHLVDGEWIAEPTGVTKVSYRNA